MAGIGSGFRMRFAAGPRVISVHRSASRIRIATRHCCDGIIEDFRWAAALEKAEPCAGYESHSLRTRISLFHKLLKVDFAITKYSYTPHVQLEQLSLGACLDCKKNLENSYSTFVVIWQKLSNHGLTRLKRYIYRQTVQLVIFLHTFNAPYIRLKIRWDRYRSFF
jgi:hypothetical protein